MSRSLSKRQQHRARQRRDKLRGRLIWGVAGLAALAVVGTLAWQALRPRAGESVPVMTSEHVPTDSDPPTSGPHYAEEARAGFFDSNIYKYPAGYLVHNLEHGYIILWYNCTQLDDAGCASLKSDMKSWMAEVDNFKVIAYPWDSSDVPLVMTSWGRILKMQTFAVAQARAFYEANLNRAPEPDAP